MPLANNPEVQKATMIKLGMDSRSPEEQLLDELREEEALRNNGGMMNIPISDGRGGAP